MAWKDFFELLVGEIFSNAGLFGCWKQGGGADGGIDLILKKTTNCFLCNAKQWRAYKVSVNVVRELLGVMVTQGAAGGFVVTSGVFTAEAQALLRDRIFISSIVQAYRHDWCVNQNNLFKSAVTQRSSPATTISSLLCQIVLNVDR